MLTAATEAQAATLRPLCNSEPVRQHFQGIPANDVKKTEVELPTCVGRRIFWRSAEILDASI